MLAADVIVLATPVYFYSMNAQLKALLGALCDWGEVHRDDLQPIVRGRGIPRPA